MEVQDQSQEINQPSDIEGAEEVVQQAHAGEAAPPPAAKEKSGLDKLREKGSVAPAAKSAAEVSADAEAAAKAAYKANLKFKAAGKEMDVPDLFKGLMTDAEKEKYIHTVLSKAHGIEMVQEKLKSTRTERDHFRSAYGQVMEPISVAREAYGRKDLDTVFQTLEMDPNLVLQWAYNKVQLSQMPPDQRQVHEARQMAERRNWELERQTRAQQQQGLSTQSEQISQMLDMVLERPDYAPLAQAYDTRKGKEGSFRDLVAMCGDQEFNRTGKIISPLEAAKMAADLLGEKVGAPAVTANAAPAPAATSAAAPAAEPRAKVVLPNAGGAKAAAPAKSKITSLDDLRKIHQKMAAN